jgi:hypothetical protein
MLRKTTLVYAIRKCLEIVLVVKIIILSGIVNLCIFTLIRRFGNWIHFRNQVQRRKVPTQMDVLNTANLHP